MRGNLITHKLENPFIKRGTYILEVRVPISDLIEGERVLERSIQDYNLTCDSLTKRIEGTQCKAMAKELNGVLIKRSNMNTFIASFFSNQKG